MHHQVFVCKQVSKQHFLCQYWSAGGKIGGQTRGPTTARSSFFVEWRASVIAWKAELSVAFKKPSVSPLPIKLCASLQSIETGTIFKKMSWARLLFFVHYILKLDDFKRQYYFSSIWARSSMNALFVLLCSMRGNSLKTKKYFITQRLSWSGCGKSATGYFGGARSCLFWLCWIRAMCIAFHEMGVEVRKM